MVEIKLPIFVINHSSHGFAPVTIKLEMQVNKRLGFIWNGAFITVNRTAPKENKFSGLLWDKKSLV